MHYEQATEVQAINEIVDEAIALYHHFVRCYDDPRLTGKPKADADDAEAAAEAAAGAPGMVPPPTCIRDGVALLRVIAPGPAAVGDDWIRTEGGYACGDVSKPLMGATDVDEGSAEAYLTAHFCIARLLGKRLDRATALRDSKESLDRFEWILRAAPRVLSRAAQPSVFAQELEICREMAMLLPTKIHRMRASGLG